MNRTLISALAVGALALSACGGDTAPEPADTPSVAVTTEAPTEAGPEDSAPAEAEESAPAETGESAPAASAADFPFEEGEVDVEELMKYYATGQSDIRTMTITQSLKGDGSEPELPEGIELPEGMDAASLGISVESESVMYVDATDRDNVRVYTVSENQAGTIETVIDGTSYHVRTDGGEWVSQDLPAEVQQDPVGAVEGLTDGLRSAQLVSAAERKFVITMDMGAPSGEATEMTLWLDDQNRPARQEIQVMGMTSTTIYSNYNEPVTIPEVG